MRQREEIGRPGGEVKVYHEGVLGQEVLSNWGIWTQARIRMYGWLCTSHPTGWLKMMESKISLYACKHPLIYQQHTVLCFLRKVRKLERLSSELQLDDHSKKAHNCWSCHYLWETRDATRFKIFFSIGHGVCP